MPPRLRPMLALALFTALNFFNYIDRSVLFAVQPLIKHEFLVTDAALGFLTTAFYWGYMVTAPAFGYFADRYRRKPLVIGGAVVWSCATLLTAVTHNFQTLLIRHVVVAIGEASFATIASPFLSDLFPQEQRGRVLSTFALANPVGTALGYILGGVLGQHYGWRVPFYVAAFPGLVLAFAMTFVGEPERGQRDALAGSPARDTLSSLVSNPAYWTVTLGNAMLTFALGGLLVWMPTFLSRARGLPLDRAGFYFGGITAFNGVFATLCGGWLADRYVRRNRGAYYLLSAGGMICGLPLMMVALYMKGWVMFPALFLAEFLLLLCTGPLNAAVINSVGAHIRGIAVALNLVVIHLMGDALSPILIGHISDRSSIDKAFAPAIGAILISAAILFYGSRFAPRLIPEKAH